MTQTRLFIDRSSLRSGSQRFNRGLSSINSKPCLIISSRFSHQIWMFSQIDDCPMNKH